jgi:hypothetical protein
MEDTAGVASAPRPRRGPAAAATGAAWLLLAALVASAGEDPEVELTRAIQALGPPGVLWGRLAVEEESPDGPWTPLAGVEVTLYPATPALLGELERLRQSARGSGAQYESAASRVQAALGAHQARVDAQSAGTPLARLPPTESAEMPSGDAPEAGAGRGPSAPTTSPSTRAPGSAGGPRGAEGPGGAGDADRPPLGRHPFQQKTDGAGLFAFEAVPAGDWLVVAVRVAPYAAEKLRAAPRPRPFGRGQRFLPRERSGSQKEAELWVRRVRVEAGGRQGLTLTDRARWLVGPVR